jgi:ferredoxin
MRKYARTWTFLSILSRVGILGVIALGALWPTYLNLVHAYNNPRIVGLSHGPTWEHFYRFVQRADALLGSEHTLSNLFFGTPPSMTLFGIPFVDPVVAPSVIINNPGGITFLAWGLIAVGVTVLVFGRGFCSFACPASLFFYLSQRVRQTVESYFPMLAEYRRALPSGLRYGILFGGTIAAVSSGVWVWNLLLPYAMVSTQLVNWVIGVPLGLSFSVFVFVIMADLFVFPGEFCRAACPLGLLLGRTSRIAVLRVHTEGRDCLEDCENCLSACDLSLDPTHGTAADCNLCGRCISVCPANKLTIRATLPFSNARTILAASVIALLFLMPRNLDAHHYHGLPHYGYFDNYPQTPTEEYISGDGRWEMNFTLYNFQGMQREDVNQPNDVQLFLVIFDLKDKSIFGGRANIEITSRDRLVAKWNQMAEQESIFLIHTEITDPDDLILKVTFVDPDGKSVTLSSPFQLPGEGGQRPLVWVGAALILLVVALIFAGKQKRPLRRRVQRKES